MKIGDNQRNIAIGGKTVYGGTVGVCMLDTQFPRIPGDIANAIFLMNQSEDNSNYVIGSGEVTSIKELIEMASSVSGVDLKKHIIVNPSLLRSGDPKIIVSDPTSIRESLNWNIECSLYDLIQRIYNKLN